MPRMMRQFLLPYSVAAFAVSMVSPLPCHANDDSPVQSVQSQQSPDAKFVQDLGDRAMKIITNKQLIAEQRHTEYSKLLNDSFDIKTIARFVIGRTWATATPEQQTEYMDLFKALVIRNYGDRMTLATGEGFHVVSTRHESDMDSVVLSQISHPDGSKPTAIDWRIRQKDGKMGVIDVIVEGVSLSVTQRQEYASVIQNNNGQIDGLLQGMRDQLKLATPVAVK